MCIQFPVANDQTREIRQAYGIGQEGFVGEDGKWRFEISDAYAKINNEVVEKAKSAYKRFLNSDRSIRSSDIIIPLKDVLQHEALYKLYPELKDVEVAFIPLEENVRGSFWDNKIEINSELADVGIRKTLLHEVQHYIQDREGFASGGDVDLGGQILYLTMLDRVDLDEFGELTDEREREKYLNKLLLGKSYDERMGEEKEKSLIEAKARRTYYNMYGEQEARITTARSEIPPSRGNIIRVVPKDGIIVRDREQVWLGYNALLNGDVEVAKKYYKEAVEIRNETESKSEGVLDIFPRRRGTVRSDGSTRAVGKRNAEKGDSGRVSRRRADKEVAGSGVFSTTVQKVQNQERRYSLKSATDEVDPSSVDASGTESLKKLRQAVRMQHQLSVAKPLTKEIASKMAARLLWQTNSSYNAEDLAANLTEIFSHVGEKEFDVDVFLSEGARAIKAVLEQSKTFDKQSYAVYFLL